MGPQRALNGTIGVRVRLDLVEKSFVGVCFALSLRESQLCPREDLNL